MQKILLSLLMLLMMSFSSQAAVVVVTGDINTNTNWTNNNIYLLTGFVYVTGNSTLTIQPGTLIEGDQATTGALIITRGSKIIADGTVTQPIVFTSNFPAGFRSYGDWGGLILLGKAITNDPAGEHLMEGGLDPVKGLYGGVDLSDNSGILRYVRIEFGGIAFLPNNEVNGLTCGAVGSGTIIEHVQCSYTGDDSFEWFGGSVNCKNLVAFRGLDDDFDTDNGFNGHLQFLVALRDSNIGDVSGSNGFESDNEGSSPYMNGPITNPIFSNVSIYGPMTSASSTINSNYKRALHLRRNTKTSVYNSVFTGFPVGLKTENNATVDNIIANTLQFKNNIIAGCNLPLDSSSSSTTNYYNMPNWFTSNSNSILTNSVDVMATNPYNYTNPNFLPTAGSPMLSGADFSSPNLSHPSITSVSYRGAFGATDWTKCWCEFDPQYASYTGAINYITTPVVTAGGSTTFCQGGSVVLTAPSASVYLWSNGATTQSTTITTAGSYSVTITNARGCVATSASTSVTVNPLPTATVTAGGPTSFCTGSNVVLTASAGTAWLWTPGNETTQSITVSTSGNYSCQVTNGNNCSASSVPVTVSASASPSPTIALGGSPTICAGDGLVLTSSTADSYLWSPGGATTQSITVTASGTYHVTTTNADPCNGVGVSADVTVVVNSLPSSSFTVSGTLPSFMFTNTSTSASTYLWDFGDLSSSTVESPVHIYSTNGSYVVTLKAITGSGCEDTTSQTVTVNVGIEKKNPSESVRVSVYPNPLTSISTLEINSTRTIRAKVLLFDITGKLVQTIFEGNTEEGVTKISFDASDLQSGLYFAKYISAEANKTVKLVVIK